MSEFCGHRAKTYTFLIDEIHDYKKHGIINKKSIGTKECVIQNQITLMTMLMCLLIKLS